MVGNEVTCQFLVIFYTLLSPLFIAALWTSAGLLWIICVFCVLCFSCFLICSLLPCGHLLGKGWPLGSCWWCLLYFCYFLMWYPGLGVVLDCILSRSLPSFSLFKYNTWWNLWVHADKVTVLIPYMWNDVLIEMTCSDTKQWTHWI